MKLSRSLACRLGAKGDIHKTTAKRLLCGCARHFVHREFQVNFRVIRPIIV